MGTRHLLAVQIDNEYKIAQYGQWDGYPDGQGASILEFLLGDYKKQKFIDQLRKLSWITGEEHEARWAECGKKPDAEWVDMEISGKFTKKWPELGRDCGSGILRYIQESDEPLKLKDNIDFAKDSLFCEWAYVVDIDKGTFEVFSGFNTKPLDTSERFYTEEPPELSHDGGMEYYPVRLIKSYQLDKLPTQTAFIKDLAEKDDDE